LTPTAAGAAPLGRDQPLSASLTVTTGGSASLLGDETTVAASLTATTGGSATLDVVAGKVYTSATLTVTTGGSASIEATATSSATLTVTTGGSAWLGRQWAHDPATGRGTYRLIASHRDGSRLAELNRATLTSDITASLNDVDGSGSGLSFALPKSDP